MQARVVPQAATHAMASTKSKQMALNMTSSDGAQLATSPEHRSTAQHNFCSPPTLKERIAAMYQTVMKLVIGETAVRCAP
jgi:hypothetical protein